MSENFNFHEQNSLTKMIEIDIKTRRNQGNSNKKLKKYKKLTTSLFG